MSTNKGHKTKIFVCSNLEHTSHSPAHATLMLAELCTTNKISTHEYTNLTAISPKYEHKYQDKYQNQ